MHAWCAPGARRVHLAIVSLSSLVQRCSGGPHGQAADAPVISRRGARASTTWPMLTRCLGFLCRQLSARAAARCAALMEHCRPAQGP